MPLDLPPPLPPQQAEVSVLEKRNASASKDQVIEFNLDKYRILITGNTYLSEERILSVIRVAKTPSQAILLLNALYTADGYLFVDTQYAREGNTIYVQVNEGYLAEVDAPPSIEPYFKKFEGRHGLTPTDIEPRRILAELDATRAGYTMTGKYSVDPDNPEAFTWTIDGERIPDHKPWQVGAAFGNPGNRFLGRYFGLANASYNAANGDTFGLGYAHGFTSLGNSRGGQDYNRGSLSYSTVTPWGLYGVDGAYTDYSVRGLFGSVTTNNTGGGNNNGGLLGSLPIIGGLFGGQGGGQSAGQGTTALNDKEDAYIAEINLTGNQFLYANEDTRWVLEQKLQYVDSVIEFSSPEQLDGVHIQDEQYGAGRLGTTVSTSWSLFDRNGNVEGGFGYKRGFAGHVRSDLSDPQRTKNFNILDSKLDTAYELPWNMLLGLKLKGQYSIDDRLPQQEQWVLGGPDNLSAFLPGVMVGDTGAFGNLRLQLPPGDLFGKLRYRFSLFIEAGTSEFEQARGAFKGTRSASDAGVKLEVAAYKNYQVTLYSAQKISDKNISRDVLNDAETDFFFNVQANF